MAGRLSFAGALELDYIAERRVLASWSRKRQQQALGGMIQPTTRPDADNCLKCLDALTHIVWRDDAQICELSFAERYSEQPKTVITIRQQDPQCCAGRVSATGAAPAGGIR